MNKGRIFRLRTDSAAIRIGVMVVPLAAACALSLVPGRPPLRDTSLMREGIVLLVGRDRRPTQQETARPAPRQDNVPDEACASGALYTPRTSSVLTAGATRNSPIPYQAAPLREPFVGAGASGRAPPT